MSCFDTGQVRKAIPTAKCTRPHLFLQRVIVFWLHELQLHQTVAMVCTHRQNTNQGLFVFQCQHSQLLQRTSCVMADVHTCLLCS
mmetsp:Transcript_31576/g.77433  ORF Transcript_31576/g.77433 Transcript_31576/m.77433 type:complete len:85 (+) Transcript_31576:104-358(+)